MRHDIWILFYRSVIFTLYIIVSLCANEVLAEIKDPTIPIYFDDNVKKNHYAKVNKRNKSIHIQSIFFSKNSKSVIINGKVFREGSTIKDLSVISIHNDHVVIKHKKNKIKLHIFKKTYVDNHTGAFNE